MIVINPIKTIKKPIAFGDTPRVYDSKTAILALQSPSSKLGFEKDYFISQKADAVQQNPIKAVGYKLAKTYKELTTQITNPHISFMA